MTIEQQYFLSLVRAHLNRTEPSAPTDIDFEALFQVSEIQNMTALIAIELKKLKKSGIITAEQFSPFNQVLGLTVRDYEFKEQGIHLLADTLSNNQVRHLFVKAVAIRPLYPVPEVRTSGDADVVVDTETLMNATELLQRTGFKQIHQNETNVILTYHGEEYEVKTNLKALNSAGNAYFENVFASNLADTENGYTYTLKPLHHLVYIMLHFIRHLTSGGAGIRQMCDMDVLLRNCDISLNEFLAICEELHIQKAACVILSLLKEYFATPIDIDYTIEPDLRQILEHVILDGGTFGYGVGDIGTAHLTRAMQSGKSSKGASLRAFLGLFIISKESLKHHYAYARKHPLLLPVAYFNRLYAAVFKRRKQNIKHIKSIFSDSEIAAQMAEMLRLLEIE